MRKIIVVSFILLKIPLIIFAQIPFASSELALVFIDTKGKTIIEDTKIDANMGVVWNFEKENSIADSYNNYHGLIGIEIRGNSSATWEKKPYKVETRNPDKSNNNYPLIGLPKENDWVLHAPYMDKSLMRNALMYRLAREMGWYAPRYKFCNLILNNEYMGVYLLVESLKRDKNRINIDDPADTTSPDSITGGYILEMTTSGRLNPDEPYIKGSSSGHLLAISSPKTEDLTEERIDYIGNYINEFESRLKSKTFSGAFDYKNLINVESFIDHMLIAEVFRQLDAFCASHYFIKDTNDLLQMGPAWDFNRTMGNYKSLGASNTNDFWLLQPRSGCRPFWSMNMYSDENFMLGYKARYRELRENLFSLTHIFGIFDEYNTFIGSNREDDYKRWPLADRNKGVNEAHFSYNEEMTYIRNWLIDRFTWLDKQWGVTPHPIINELYADGTQSNKQWIELYNPYEKSVDISDWELVLNNGEATYVFPSNTIIASEDYLVICTTKKAVDNLPEETNVIEGLNFNFNEDDIQLQLREFYSQNLDEISISIGRGWPNMSTSGNYSIGLNPWFVDNALGCNWNWSKNAKGTPGTQNINFNYEGLRITEVMSSNSNTLSDNHGEFDDWVEIYNDSDRSINLLSLFLSDNDVVTWQWKIHGTVVKNETILNPGQTAIIWMDGDTEQGILHANFKLDKEGSNVVLSRSNGFEYFVIDKIKVPPLLSDQSYMCTNIKSNEWQITDHPNPNSIVLTTVIEKPMVNNPIDVKVFPNPVKNSFDVEIKLNNKNEFGITLVGIDGRVKSIILPQTKHLPGLYTFNYQLNKQVSSGIYIVRIQGKGFVQNTKILVSNQ